MEVRRGPGLVGVEKEVRRGPGLVGTPSVEVRRGKGLVGVERELIRIILRKLYLWNNNYHSPRKTNIKILFMVYKISLKLFFYNLNFR